MFTLEEFTERLVDAYEHLYDLVYLRSHPFAESLVDEPSQRHKERAWQLHYVLVNVIQELNPGPQAPTFSREWRRYRLLTLRYVDGLAPQVIADQLAISRRHYYRAHDEALHALASILWQRYAATQAKTPQAITVPVVMATDRLEMLRLEATQMAHKDKYSAVDTVLDGVITLLKEEMLQRSVTIATDISEQAVVAVDKTLLRQLFIGVLGYLIENLHNASIRIVATLVENNVTLDMIVESASTIDSPANEHTREHFATFEELAALSSTTIQAITTGSAISGFKIVIPAHQPQRTVIVIDDNQDVLELFQRYLSVADYEVALAQNAQQALAYLKQVHPFAIILDLMMPDQDGWDLLQMFSNQPDTQDVPIIVCSVLKQKDLALSLGATYFLQKPISEQQLISVLELLQ